VELQPKEPKRDRLRELTRKRVEQLETAGRQLNLFEIECWWHLEAFRFLKRGSRAISLIDYKAEKEFVDKVRHVVLLSNTGVAESRNDKPKGAARRARRPRDCPF